MNLNLLKQSFDHFVRHDDKEHKVKICFNSPSVRAFNQIRADAGWGEVDPTLAQNSLNQSLFHVCLYCDNDLAAYGRVIGDGALFYYVQDVVVKNHYQGQGLGHFIMEHIQCYLADTVCNGATVGLLSVKGKESFYQRYGYQNRDGEVLGLGMCQFY